MQHLVVVEQLDARSNVDHCRCAGCHTGESAPDKPLRLLARDHERIEHAQKRVGNAECHHDDGRNGAGYDHSNDSFSPAWIGTQFIGQDLPDSGESPFD